jgi:integrase
MLNSSSFPTKNNMRAYCAYGRGASYLLESSWKKPYSDRGIRRLLERYAEAAGLAPPHLAASSAPLLADLAEETRYRRCALVQPYSGHASRQSLEIYSRLAMPMLRQPTPTPCAGSRSEARKATLLCGW